MNFLRKQHRFVVCQFGDTHGGNDLGLMNPDVKLRDSRGQLYSPQLNEGQIYLHELHEKHANQVIDFAEGDDLYLIHLGDASQGNKYIPERISSRIADQFQIGRANFWYWTKYKNLKGIRLAVGTPAHNFGEQTSEEVITEYLKDDLPSVDIAVIYHGLLNVRGATIDYAHRGPSPGRRNWLKGNEARYYLRSFMEDDIHAGNVPAQIVTRAHYHSFVEEYLSIKFRDSRYKSWLYVLPSYCLMGEFGVNVTASQCFITNGMIASEVIDGQIRQTIILEQTLDIRTKETL